MKTIGEPNLFSKFFGVRFKGDEISLLFFWKKTLFFQHTLQKSEILLQKNEILL